MPIFPGSRDEVAFYSKKFLCVDKEDYSLYGDYNSARAQQFNVQFLRCNAEDHPDVDCASEEEITEFIRNKFMLILYNQVRFDSNFYGEEAITKESRVMYVQVNSQI